MIIQEKLRIIQKINQKTQVQLAGIFGVSYATFNSWWLGKSQPRSKKLELIEELYLELTGQKIIPPERLAQKIKSLEDRLKRHPNPLGEILTNPDIRDNLILKLTYHTNRIEGSTLTEPDTAAILFGNNPLPEKSLVEHLEAKNHQTALNYLFDYLTKKGEVSEDLVLKLHGILMNGIRPDAGFYRRHAVRILGVNLPTANYLKIPGLIPPLIVEASGKTDNIINLSAHIHARFEQIHPFSDGNGRIGRLLLTAMLLKENYAPAIIDESQRRLYYVYLYKAQTKGDLSQLEDFLADCIFAGLNLLERKG